MPLIKPKSKSKKSQLRITVDDQILEQIHQYCSWANLGKPDEFFEQAAEFILAKDKDWQNYYSAQTAK